MNRFGWSAVEVAARLLSPRERETVLGDLREAGEGSWDSFYEVLGLFFRRQLAHWKDWRPWLAVVGVSWPGSLTLMGLSVSISLGSLQLIRVGGARIDNIYSARSAELAARILLLVGWAWTGGFVIGSISRKTLWASCIAMGLPCLFCLTRFNIDSLSKFSLLLFLPPVIWGIIQGLRGVYIRSHYALMLAGFIILPLIFARGVQVQVGSHLRTWLLDAILSWPLVYVVATASRSPSKQSILR